MNTFLHNLPKSKFFSWALLAACTLIWGTSYILIKKSLITFAPPQVACFRIGLTGLAFLPVFLMQYKKIEAKYWKFIVVTALCGNIAPAFLFSAAQVHIASSLAGILNSLTPLFVLVTGHLIFGKKMTLFQALGILVGLVGAVALMAGGKDIMAGSDNRFGLLIVLATLLYSISANTIGTYLKDLPAPAMLSGAFMITLVPAWVYLFASGAPQLIVEHEHGFQSFSALLFLALIGTMVANIIFVMVIQRLGTLSASMVSYLMPIVAMSWGLLDGESLGLFHLLGFALILSGVWLVGKKR